MPNGIGLICINDPIQEAEVIFKATNDRISKDCKGNKKGQTNNKIDLSLIVAGAGLARPPAGGYEPSVLFFDDLVVYELSTLCRFELFFPYHGLFLRIKSFMIG
ncbi:MAG: hypothetical protein PF486_01690 [Prolixibacteraceae bacterium]|jgi:hypothetical protein|nr:hypothetical protein [Prolixibacteraceae bacterium]